MFELLVHSDALNFDNHNRLNFVHSDVVGILKHCSYALMFSRPPPMSHQLKHSLPTIFTCGPVIHWQAQCFTLTIFFYVHPQSVCPMHLWQVGMKWYRAHNDLRFFHRHVTTAEDAETRRGGGAGRKQTSNLYSRLRRPSLSLNEFYRSRRTIPLGPSLDPLLHCVNFRKH